MTTSDATILFW